MAKKYDFFWNTMKLCDWGNEGDDDKVLEPVIQYLSKQDDSLIFKFDDLMIELLHQLDTKKLLEQCEKVEPLTSDDSFLYSRCVALINGPAYYEKVLLGEEEGVWSMEFEALLYVPQKAWALKHNSLVDYYPHSFHYGADSDQANWKNILLNYLVFLVCIIHFRFGVITAAVLPVLLIILSWHNYRHSDEWKTTFMLEVHLWVSTMTGICLERYLYLKHVSDDAESAMILGLMILAGVFLVSIIGAITTLIKYFSMRKPSRT
ncbi:MAG: DUF4240 domain-containing protein [Lachnoclostridium sp.]|nr:DUF4240 domain-containing protein [Lachnoclostridium sp.]MCM1384378.1 DUF4240 domain-containing protein [Lachnoclostridium sp.]